MELFPYDHQKVLLRGCAGPYYPAVITNARVALLWSKGATPKENKYIERVEVSYHPNNHITYNTIVPRSFISRLDADNLKRMHVESSHPFFNPLERSVKILIRRSPDILRQLGFGFSLLPNHGPEVFQEGALPFLISESTLNEKFLDLFEAS